MIWKETGFFFSLHNLSINLSTIRRNCCCIIIDISSAFDNHLKRFVKKKSKSLFSIKKERRRRKGGEKGEWKIAKIEENLNADERLKKKTGIKRQSIIDVRNVKGDVLV